MPDPAAGRPHSGQGPPQKFGGGGILEVLIAVLRQLMLSPLSHDQISNPVGQMTQSYDTDSACRLSTADLVQRGLNSSDKITLP